jgi:Flp pilus assembly protein TadD
MTTQESSEKRKAINGVFSSQEVKKVGTGTTTKKSIQKTFWFCIEQDDGTLEVQPLNPNYVPSGPKKKITMEQFLNLFAPEPELYVSNVYPKMRELNKTIARAERHKEHKEYFSAEMEYNTALKVDEDNVRANFGLGITYLERGETGKAESIFGRLVKLDAAFDVEHNHLCNECGINLRKNGMLDQAVSYYNRAVELATQDEHLYHNLARAYLEKKDIPHALEYLLKSLEINPALETSVKFLLWMVSKKLITADYKAAVEAMLKKIKEGEHKGDTPSAAAGADSAPAGASAGQEEKSL